MFFVNCVVHPSVSMTALDNLTIGESFLMECNVTVAKGIIGSLDIIWKANGTAMRRVKNILGGISSEFGDVYSIPILQLSDNNTVYHCEASVNTSTPLNGSDSITLTIGKHHK